MPCLSASSSPPLPLNLPLLRTSSSSSFDSSSSARTSTLAPQALCDLYALRCIEAEPLFRNDEFIAPGKAKAISRLIVSLCSELRGVALPLVNAWAIPDHILRAPIGLGAHSGVDMYKEYLHSVGFDV